MPLVNLDRFFVRVEGSADRLHILLASSDRRYENFGVRAQLKGPLASDIFDSLVAVGVSGFSVRERDAYTIITVEKPNPGVWRIDLSVAGPNFSDQRGYLTVLTQSDDGPRFTSTLSERFVTDTALGTTVSAQGRYKGFGLENASVRGILVKPDGSNEAFTVSGSEDPHHGAPYQATFQGPQLVQAGRYEVRLSLSAIPPQTNLVSRDHESEPLPEAFERTAIESFWVLTPGGTQPCVCLPNEDCDNDGVFGESNTLDSDGDLLPNACDIDSDNDEVDDGFDNPGANTDNDGRPDQQDSDSDNDGIPDSDDPGPGRCLAPRFWFEDVSTDCCQPKVILRALMEVSGPVSEIFVPVTLPPFLPGVTVTPGVDAAAVGVKELSISPGQVSSTLEVKLSFDPLKPLGPGHQLHLFSLTYERASRVCSPLLQACPSVPNSNMPLPSVMYAGGACPGLSLPPLTYCGQISSSSADSDNDTVGDGCDNCPLVINRLQEDIDLNGIGDACEVSPSACSDGIDNDGDGLADLADLGCTSFSDLAETNANVACDNGIDDDLDGNVDLNDAQCESPLDNSEASLPGDEPIFEDHFEL